ncbi:MAG TPA: kelch repeat-containing protein [Actinomycetes bacterium]|nr:kelch repeat-containing protein [Actinomycetes bacterium]
MESATRKHSRSLVTALLTGALVTGIMAAAGFAGPEAQAATASFRVNAGGPEVAGTPVWSADTASSPSPFLNQAQSNAKVTATTSAITLDPGVPADTPVKVFKKQRYDPASGAEMAWSFPTTTGAYDVRLYFAEIYPPAQQVGSRVFDVSIEGSVVLNNYDIYADVGANTGVVKEFRVQSDTALNVAFDHVVDNPVINAIEIIPASGGAALGFGKSTLIGESSNGVTSVQFGPDNRLYAAQFNGLIKAYTIARTGPNTYEVTDTESIDLIQKIPNHNDDGSSNSNVSTRIITGMLVTGSASAPVVYATSSDPRIGGGGEGSDLNLDTNSSMLSRLDWNGTSWSRLNLVRGLPRSEENHSANGLQLDPATNTMYVAMGGNTNEGAPSNNFAFLPEYALSAAVLEVDLDAIGNTTYDLPTLDDEDRAGSLDANDPFGGNDGKNQARLVAGGPVQVFAPGFRNPYDLLRHSNGQMYTIDNGSNAGWGDVPIGEGPTGSCSNAPNEPGISAPDTLHLLSEGYYGGHPNPTRGNTSNTFNANAQSPVNVENPVECDYIAPNGVQSTALTSWKASTNGLAEYTASNFAGAMQGDILTAGFVSNSISRVQLNDAGTAVTANTPLFSTVGQRPLDVVSLGDEDAFPGTIWVGDQANGSIYVFEPNDYDANGGSCTGADSAALDEDGDGYSNADELDNNTNPCSSGDIPADADSDFVSDINDPDDDNDGTSDSSDRFAVDDHNGLSTELPISYSWNNGAPNPGGLLGLGFTGLMNNGSSDYLSQFDADQMTSGGAAGVTTVDAVDPGTATGASNDQKYGFQFGFAPATTPFTAHTAILAPFAGVEPTGKQSMGLFVGTGDQDNYVKVVATAGNGSPGIQVEREVNGTTSASSVTPVNLPGPNAIDLYLTVDPESLSVQASYSTTAGGQTSDRIPVGQPQPIPSGWLNSNEQGMATGIISTSSGGGTFPATWDFMEVEEEAAAPPTNVVAQDGFNRTVNGGWGQADVGGTWKIPSGAASFSVDGTNGAIQLDNSVGGRQAVLTSTSVADVEAAVTTGFSALPTSGKEISYVLVRRQTGNAYYRIGIWVNSKGKIGLRGQTNSGTTIIPDQTTALTWDANASYRLKVQVTGANPTTISAKVWPTTASEPSAWTATGTSTATGLQGSGNVGLRATSASANPVRHTFDNFVARPVSGDSSSIGSWTTAASTGFARQEVSYVRAGDSLYLAGGSTRQQKYNPAQNAWSEVAPLPVSIDHIQGVEVGGRIYYIGGLIEWPDVEVGTVYVYDPQTNTVSQGSPMPRPRGAGGVAVHDGKIYYAGGLSNGEAVPWFDVYDPATDTWAQLPNMPTARDHFHAAVLDDQFWAIGGRDAAIDATVTVNESFDFGSGEWVAGHAALPTARGGFAVARLGSELLVIGGEGGGQVSNVVEAYEPATDTWRTLAPMPTARHGIQAVTCNGSVYVAAGGTQQGRGPTAVQEVLSIGPRQPCPAP